MVFCGPTGKLMCRGSAGQVRRLRKAADLGAAWHQHEQRHTFVSALSEAGIPIESISEAAL
ncbi:MAG: tyrosine-type recombinase/integrase [Streptosporangiaceae bacterium]